MKFIRKLSLGGSPPALWPSRRTAYPPQKKHQTTIFVDPAASGRHQTTVFVDPTAPGSLQTTIFVDPAAPGRHQTTIFVDPAAPGRHQTTGFVNPAAPGSLQITIPNDPASPGSLQITIFVNPAAPGSFQITVFCQSSGSREPPDHFVRRSSGPRVRQSAEALSPMSVHPALQKSASVDALQATTSDDLPPAGTIQTITFVRSSASCSLQAFDPAPPAASQASLASAEFAKR